MGYKNAEDAAGLARRWMLGTRRGSNREAWRHPEDLVRVLTNETPFRFDVKDALEFDHELAVAWLHDILEDGLKEDGTPVRWLDLRAEGVPDDVIEDVLVLTRGELSPPETKAAFLTRVQMASPRARRVKTVDRVCNLREAKETFSDGAWLRYVGETYYFILPMTERAEPGREDGFDSVQRGWARNELIKAAQARTVKTLNWPERAV